MIRIPPLLFAAAACVPLAPANDLAPFSDEFGDPATLALYAEHGAAEGWGASLVQHASVHSTTPGHFRLIPDTSAWYRHLRGTLFSRDITGDFIVTVRLRVFSRVNPAGPLAPSLRLFSLAGILVREPRAITQAAPVPPTALPVWPPQAFGSDWTPGDEVWGNAADPAGKGENYVFLSYGTAGVSGQRSFEIKTTRRSNSSLYFASTGMNPASNEVWLQIVRVGGTVVCLRKHGPAEPWIVENRYPNPAQPLPQFGPTLQVGLTAYTDWDTIAPFEAGGIPTQFHFNYAPPSGQPDLIAEFDYFRVRRPPAALTEAVLQGIATSYNPALGQTAPVPVPLSASPAAAPHLGDAADVPAGGVAFQTWRTTHFGPAADGPTAQPLQDADEDTLPNVLEFALAGSPVDQEPSPVTSTTVAAPWEAGTAVFAAAAFPVNAAAVGTSLTLETSTDLAAWTDGATYVVTAGGLVREPGGQTVQHSVTDLGGAWHVVERAATPFAGIPLFARVRVQLPL